MQKRILISVFFPFSFTILISLFFYNRNETEKDKVQQDGTVNGASPLYHQFHRIHGRLGLADEISLHNGFFLISNRDKTSKDESFARLFIVRKH